MNNNIFVKEIYINNKPLILTNAAEKYISKNEHTAGYLLLSGAFSRNIRLAKKHLETALSYGAIIHDVSPEALEDLLLNEFTPIQAAGGLVVNTDKQVLLILRRGYWDLPKGKLDEGESIPECAVREVQEETGLKNIELEEKLGSTFHVYTEKGITYLKSTDWFLMHSEDTELSPQINEGIIMAKWANNIEATLLLKKSFPAIQALVDNYYN